jgi:hypothetical protein
MSRSDRHDRFVGRDQRTVVRLGRDRIHVRLAPFAGLLSRAAGDGRRRQADEDAQEGFTATYVFVSA